MYVSKQIKMVVYYVEDNNIFAECKKYIVNIRKKLSNELKILKMGKSSLFRELNLIGNKKVRLECFDQM